MIVPLLQLWLSVGGQRLIASTYLLVRSRLHCRMQVLFGLRIDGDVVYIQDATRRILPWRTLLETLTGCTIAPTDMDGASRVRIHSITGYLRDQLQVDPIRMLLQWNEWRGLLDFTCLLY